MRSPLLILSLLAINRWTAMGDKRAAHGTEGGILEIRCPYPDDYIHVPKFFCRDPCGNKDVLIKSEKTDTVIRSGRFSIIDHPNERSFTVTITSLKLQDAGPYYCGIDTWFRDKKEKVKVTVSKVPMATPSSSAPVPAQTVTDSPSHTHAVWTSDRVSTDQTITTTTAKAKVPDGYHSHESHIVVGAALGVLVCLLLVALAVLLRRRVVSQSIALKPEVITPPADTVQAEEGVEHAYDDMMLYSMIGPPLEDSVTYDYCTVQFPDPPQEDDEAGLYSLVAPH
ncbi:hypothetical protein AGOR_G00140460 [Albula goreensis]|uniref:Immunoglobulin domain-containing protein n=1 Tax=Albula goreensis TaxID=1534307 RepID=A0A8T3DBI8_9TELE|nr:hypothetical protein AGOR_G00140460 [Albula goreensis]